MKLVVLIAVVAMAASDKISYSSVQIENKNKCGKEFM
jgi:hypothetical protein